MIRFAATAAIAAAVLSAGAASASEYRIAFRDLDLGSIAGAARLDQRIESAAEQACLVGAPLADAQCVRRFRIDALRQLPQAHRDNYARARGDRMVVRTPVDPS